MLIKIQKHLKVFFISLNAYIQIYAIQMMGTLPDTISWKYQKQILRQSDHLEIQAFSSPGATKSITRYELSLPWPKCGT